MYTRFVLAIRVLARQLREETKAVADIAMCIVEREDDGYILLLKRSQDEPWEPGKWNLPGGHVDPGETPLAACKRETLEECAVQVKNVRLLQRMRLPARSLWVYHSDDWTGTPSPQAGEVAGMRWVPVAKALSMDIVPNLDRILASFKKSERREPRGGSVAPF
jgi:8-oxo-dGTP diphosphatase